MLRSGFGLLLGCASFHGTVQPIKRTVFSTTQSLWRTSALSSKRIQSVQPTRDVEDFFDKDLKNNIEEYINSKGQVSAKPVVTGKPWNTVDLQKKSFDDLHKLWFVLLKERNMLLTEQLRWKTRPEVIKEFKINVRARKVRKSMARIKGLLELRKHEYHRYLGLRQLKEIKDNNEHIPRETRKKLRVPLNLSEEQKYKRRLRTFTMTYKNKFKRQLLQRLQHESNKLGKRFDNRPRLSVADLEKIKGQALAKTDRRMKRDSTRQEAKEAKQEEISKIIQEQQQQQQQQQ